MQDFEIALSFAGAQRPLVSDVADWLTAKLGAGHVFYDRYFAAELARPDLDLYLEEIYRNRSELVVIFLSKDYEDKEWCGLEWRAVRDLILQKASDQIMLVRVDEVPISGVLEIDGYLDAAHLDAATIAGQILERLRSLKQSPRKVPSPNLAPPPPHFIGREHQLSGLVAAVLAERPLPIPLLGPPGVGKTNLSLMCLHDKGVITRFGDHRYFVRCNGSRNLDALIAATAAALPSIAEISKDQVIQDLERAPSLLILDNLETPWESDRQGVEAFLAQLAAVASLALVVSLRGNRRPARVHWGETVNIRPLAIADARKMFLEVTGARHRTDPYLDQLVSAVDGLPLALLLIAYHAEVLPDLEELHQRWKTLLQRADRSTAEPSVEASVMLSFRSPRMSPLARKLASILAILPDGAEVADLTKILRKDAWNPGIILREMGLVDADARRLRLLAPIREVLLRKSPPPSAAREAITAYFLGLVKLADAVGASGEAEAVRRLTPEIGNLDAILSIALEKIDPTPALDGVLSFSQLQAFTGLGGYSLVRKAIDIAKRARLDSLTARCQFALGELASGREGSTAQSAYEEALGLFHSLGNKAGEADCLKGLGYLDSLHFHLLAAEKRYKEAHTLYAGIQDARGQAACIESLGDIAEKRSDYDAARIQYEDALRLYGVSSYTLDVANVTEKLAGIAFRRFQHHEAVSAYQAALEIYRQAGSIAGESRCRRGLGDISLQAGDYESARLSYEEALRLDRRSGSVVGEANCNEKLGDVAGRSSDFEAACAYYREARGIYQRAGDALGEAGCILSLGTIALRTSDLKTAKEQFTDALARYETERSTDGEAACILSLGRLALASSDYGKARLDLEHARALYHDLGHLPGEADCVTDLADLAGVEGHALLARELLCQALSLYERLSNQLSIGATHRSLSRLSESDSEKSEHMAATRHAWAAIGRLDLIAELDAGREVPRGAV